MTLSQKQRLFSKMIAELILWAYDKGYEITLGDAYRDPRVHGALGVKMAYGARNSCHKLRLAMDLNLFKDGKYCTDGASHGPLGEKWESMGGSWGGRFQDANHYSLEHDGFK
jgi:hypothetical protein